MNKETGIKSLSFLDELYNYLTIPEAHPPAPTPTKPVTHIRITLNRPLTWSERESLRELTFFNEDTGESSKVTTEFHNHSVFSATSSVIGSRNLYELFADYIGEEFINVYGRAVRTFSDVDG